MSSSTDPLDDGIGDVEEFYANRPKVVRRISAGRRSISRGYNRPKDLPRRRPKNLVDITTFRFGEPLTDLQRETIESHVAQLRELLKMLHDDPNHPRSIAGNNPRERAAAQKALLALISEAEKRLTT